jgi:pyrimidine operon attenuation protein / uracil phosphoribosyltransferase
LDDLAALIPENSVVVGIRTGGEGLADRLVHALARDGKSPTLGLLDIALYRDDLGLSGGAPRVLGTDLPHDLDGRFVVLVDDVFYTGRTIRAALSRLSDHGRPSRVLLAVLCARPGRELPIFPDVVGIEIDDPGAGAKVLLDLDGGTLSVLAPSGASR